MTDVRRRRQEGRKTGVLRRRDLWRKSDEVGQQAVEDEG